MLVAISGRKSDAKIWGGGSCDVYLFSPKGYTPICPYSIAIPNMEKQPSSQNDVESLLALTKRIAFLEICCRYCVLKREDFSVQ